MYILEVWGADKSLLLVITEGWGLEGTAIGLHPQSKLED